MESGSLLMLVCAVSVIFGFFVNTVHAMSPCQHVDQQGKGPLRCYSREFLLGFQNSDSPIPTLDFPSEMYKNGDSVKDRKCKRGKKGGVRRRLKKARTCPPLPSIILSNVRSLRPKAPNTTFDELQGNVVFRSEFREACVLCFTETWFCENISDDSVTIDGFGSPFRCDRDCDVTGKKRGGGVCMYINEVWCPRNNVTVRKHLNTCDVDLLSLSLRPRYLPREFGQVFVSCVHPPLGLSSTGCTAGSGHREGTTTVVS